jgi:hypothetical protein
VTSCALGRKPPGPFSRRHGRGSATSCSQAQDLGANSAATHPGLIADVGGDSGVLRGEPLRLRPYQPDGSCVRPQHDCDLCRSVRLVSSRAAKDKPRANRALWRGDFRRIYCSRRHRFLALACNLIVGQEFVNPLLRLKRNHIVPQKPGGSAAAMREETRGLSFPFARANDRSRRSRSARPTQWTCLCGKACRDWER